MKQFKSVAMAVLALAIAVSYALVPVSHASATSSSALSIAPKKNYVINPGSSVKDTLVITNLDPVNELDLSLKVIDFTFEGDDGTPKLMLDPSAPQTTWSLKPYLTVPQSVTIAPGASRTLNMNVAIPKYVGAGSYYSAIIYSSGSGGSNSVSNVGLSASGVTLVFVNVPGQVHENLQLKQFGAYDIQGGYHFMMANEPQNMAYTLKNNGNVVESPTGTITLKDMWGHTTTVNNVNPAGSLALIGQTRTFIPCIKTNAQNVNFAGSKSQLAACADPGLWPGMYTATIDLYYGQNGNETQEILKTVVFWYLPWWFVIGILVILAIIAYFVWRIVRFIRSKLYSGPSRVKKLSRRR